MKKENLNEVASEVIEETNNAVSCLDTRTKVIVAAASVLTLGLAVGAFFGIRALRARRNKKNADVSEGDHADPEAQNPNA